MSDSSGAIPVTIMASQTGVQAALSDMNVLNDVNLTYSLNSTVLKCYGDVAINNFIDNLLTTEIGTRHWEPLFGSNVANLIWEPCDNITAWQLETATYDAIKQWIPYLRPILSKTQITPLPNNDGFYVYLPWRNIISNKIGVYQANLYRAS